MSRQRVVIIGSGLGGLSSGLILSRNGYDVTILEQGAQIGGCLQCFRRQGVKFETGMHFIGSADEGQVLNRLLRYLGVLDDIRLSRLDINGYNVVSLDGQQFRFANGREAFIETLAKDFPHERDGLHRYFDLVERVASASSLRTLRRADSDASPLNTTFQLRSMNEVISEESAHKMLYMLKAVVEGGTAGRLRYKYNIPGDIAGKTGTTNNNSDAWFMGITPTLVSGCWVGGEDRDIHFTMTSMGQGAAGALPVWAYYMKRVYADKRLGYNENAVFDLPAGFNPCQYDESGLEDVPENDVGEIFE